MKIWEIIIDIRLREETRIGEEQFGSMPGRGITDAISAARQVIIIILGGMAVFTWLVTS